MSYTILTGNSGFASMRNIINTTLLIHSDTTDGSTTFADSSVSGHTVDIAAADVAHDTAQMKFGKTSILFDGDSGYLSIDDHTGFDFSAGTWSIDTWIRLASSGSGDIYYQETDATNYIKLSIQSNDEPSFIIAVAGLAKVSIDSNYVLSTDQWYHLAIVQNGSGNDPVLYINGMAKSTNSGAGADPSNYTGSVYIGGNGNYFDGWMDEFRVVKGKAMWTTNFTPPIGPYT